MSIYKRHKCALLLPLVMLIVVDVIAFLHITDDIAVLAISTTTELLIFLLTTSLTHYYIFKNWCNIVGYLRWSRVKLRGKKNEPK